MKILLPDDVLEELKQAADSKRDLPRDEERIRQVKMVYQRLTEYFAGEEGVEIRLVFEPIFINMATITVTGRQICIYDREILEMLARYATFSDLELEEETQDKVSWTLEFAGIIKGRAEE